MTNLLRRQFGAFLLSGTALVGLTACATGTVAMVALTAFETDATAILASVESFAGTEIQPLVSDDDWAKIQGYETTAGTLLTSLANLTSTITLSAGQSLIGQIEDDATDALDVLAGYASSLPADVTADITAIKTLLPIVMAAVSLSTMAAARTGMTVAEARARLARHKPLYRRR